MNKILTAITIAIATWLPFVTEINSAEAVTLYDGSLGNLPSDQGFTYQNVPGGTVTPVAGGGATNLNSTPANGPLAGFFRISPIPLNNTPGYILSFSVEILAESFTNTERAGFSVIAVGSNVSPGIPSSIEIGFQNNRVFSQNDSPLFGNPAANESMFDPVGVGFVDYDLVVSGSSYQLFANNASILNGSLRDYTAFMGAFDPYETPNFIFFGDDTTSAQANINFRSAEIIAIPFEFSPAIGLLALGGLFAVGKIGKAYRFKFKSKPQHS